MGFGIGGGGGGGGSFGGALSAATSGGGGGLPDPLGTLQNFVGGGGGPVGNFIGGIPGQLIGTGQNAGALGVGQYKADQYDINDKAFTDDSANAALRNSFQQQLAAAQARQAPTAQAAQINMGPQNEFRQYQSGLASQLAAASRGEGPSLANLQLQQGTENNIKSAMALGTSHPGNAALQQRNIMQQAAGANQQAAQAAAQNRMQEQMNAQGQLGGVLNSARGTDVGLAQNQAQLSQSANLANQQAQLSQTGLNDAQSRFYNTGIASSTEQDQANKMALEQLKANQQAGINAANASAYADASARRGKAAGALGGGAMSFAGMAKGGVVKKMADGGEIGLDSAFKNAGSFASAVRNRYGSLSSFNSPMPKDDGTNSYKLDVKKKTGESKDAAPGGLAGDPSPSDMDSGQGSSLSEDLNKTPGLMDTASALPAAHGGEVPMMCGGGMPHYDNGGLIETAMKLAPLALMLAGHGGKVPGRPEVKEDSLKNDKVPVMLSPGEIVLPRSVASEALKKPGSKTVTSFLEALKEQHMAEGGEVEDGSYAETPDVPDANKKFASAMRKAFHY